MSIAVTRLQSPPSVRKRSCMVAITKRAFSRIAPGEVSPWRTMPSGPCARSFSSPAACTLQGGAGGWRGGRSGRLAGDREVEGIERRLPGTRGDRAHVGAGDRVVVPHQDLPVGEERAVALVELPEPVEGERLRAP